ncbi:flagellar biosynthetic protein FliO [Shewanella gaetbuli]|uniref:Flagellar protein n=1 Tax=Shewanella gaetbuli TaxID=220752 RepID=A0A9X2CKI9_9GAMM|nr:flagellar biosynthetic protein FliO [Shewanella gaetbuli]
MSIFSVILSQTVTAAEPLAAVDTVSTSASNTAFVSTLANMLGGLIVVIALIFLLAYIVKKLNLAPSQHGIIKTIATTQVGHKEKIMLIEVNEQQYLVGVTASQVNLLDKMAQPVESNTTFAKNLQQAKEASND